MTNSLKQTQENFQAYVINDDHAIKKMVAGSDDEFISTRLDIYRDGYGLRLLEILEKTYPVLRTLVGEEKFNQLGLDYISAYPSHHFSVGYFGRHFSKFLSLYVPSEPIWAEIAIFEWALEEVVETPDAPCLTFEAMSTVPPEAWANLRLIVHPSAQLISFFYRDIPLVWEALRDGKEKPSVEASAKPATWLIWRYNLQAYYAYLTQEQTQMFKDLRDGQSFPEVCEKLCQQMSEEEVTQFTAETLRNWIVEGVFAEVKFDE